MIKVYLLELEYTSPVETVVESSKEPFCPDFLLAVHVQAPGEDLHCTVLSCTALTVLSCTVLHFNTLFLTEVYCTTMYYTVLHCDALYYTELQWNALNCTALYCTGLHCTVLHWIIVNSTTLNFTALSTEVQCAVQHLTTLYLCISVHLGSLPCWKLHYLALYFRLLQFN